MGTDTIVYSVISLIGDGENAKRILAWCKKNKKTFYMWKVVCGGDELFLTFDSNYRVRIDEAMEQFLLITPLLRKCDYTGSSIVTFRSSWGDYECGTIYIEINEDSCSVSIRAVDCHGETRKTVLNA